MKLAGEAKLLLLVFSIIGVPLIPVSASPLPEFSFHYGSIQFQHVGDLKENKTGTFFVSNSSTEVHIFTLDHIPQIGQKWNITFTLDPNSTTGVSWRGEHGSGMWEGPNQFNLTPGYSITNQFISHVCGDNYDVLFIRFYLQLFNSTATVSGSFFALQLFAGYTNPQECNTGMLVVDDIDEWLNSFSPSIIDPLLVGLLAIVITTAFILYKKKF